MGGYTVPEGVLGRDGFLTERYTWDGHGVVFGHDDTEGIK